MSENTYTTATTGGVEFSQPIEVEYSSIISQYISYFNELPDTGKKRFLERTAHFRSLKQFNYIGMEEKKEIPILISAAAIQITYGLEKYELPFFRNIYVTPDAYQKTGEREIFIGHVSPDGIYISWKYFLQGYLDKTDNVNVAIHELAHALEHESFIDDTTVDKDFKTDFAKFSSVSGPVFASVIVQRRSYLRSYAFTNVQEFWAVSVEAFFENPAGLKQNMPELYGILCDVLNQDPLTVNKILQK
ncbi:MAG TPA: zinc-dependent peptidase [Chitinophagaceae bacterium]|nr:zinc-dependent peptidase [Chitinophagaceae bacterium]